MKVLVCADSFGVNTTQTHPGTHFTDQIMELRPDWEIINLSMHGASNSLIQIQLNQGLNLKPDAVIMSFTDPGRMELPLAEYPELTAQHPDFIRKAKPGGALSLTNQKSVNNWNRRRWLTNCWFTNRTEADQYHDSSMRMYDSEAQAIKNVHTARGCMDLLHVKSIPFCYSLGGLGGRRMVRSYKALFKENFMNVDVFADYQNLQISTNLWDHQDTRVGAPAHHVSDVQVAKRFASECVEILCRDQKYN